MSAALGPIRAALRRGAWSEARHACEAALAEATEQAEVYYALGISYFGENAYAAAVAPLEAALALDSSRASRARDLAAVYAKLERWADVVRVLTPVVHVLDPVAQALYLSAAIDSGEAMMAVGVLEARGHPEDSDVPDLQCDYGRALVSIGRLEDAEAALVRCLTGPGALARAHDVFAFLCMQTGRGDRGLLHWRAYAALRPDSGYAQLRLAIGLSLRGRLEESRAARLEALRLGIKRPCDWTGVLILASYDTREDGRTFAATAARSFEHIQPSQRPAVRRRTVGDGRLRIGYTSAEFDVPPGSFFMNPFLLTHDRTRFEVFIYDTRREQTPSPAERVRLADHVRDVGHLSDEALLERIRTDRIDVLVELSAHFPHSRLSVYAMGAAPVQATLPQCPTTTGCRQVDHIFSDRWTTPPGTEHEYVERVHRVDTGCVVFTPPKVCPPARTPPITRGRTLTFGMLQRFAKMGADVWDAVAAVLRATPDSQFLIHNGDGELDRPDSDTARFLRTQLEVRGVDPRRLRLAGPMPHVAHLDLISDIDVALDTWPYSGTTTTCECIWMGVPVVTLSGRSHASRVSAALLQRMDLGNLVAPDAAGYIAKATRQAADIDGLRSHRSTMRDRAIASGLTDGRALAAAMESAYEQWVALA